MQNTSYLQSQTLLKNMRSNKSVSGRHQHIATLLKKGTTIDHMIKSVGASRRTIFRYLNHFEEAGYNINIESGQYRILQ